MPRYRTVYSPGHALAHKNGTLPEHRFLLYGKIGAGPHPCHWCGTAVDWTPGEHTKRGSLVVDHLDNDGHNNAPDNLVPSCHTCNVRRGLQFRVLKDGEQFITFKNGDRLRAVEAVCGWCHATFLVRKKQSRENHGQFCSRACSRRGSFAGRTAPARRFLTDDQVREIRALLATSALSQRVIGERFGVSRGSVDMISRGKSYQHVL